MSDPTICLELEPITSNQWSLLHDENGYADIQSVPVELPETSALETLDEYITTNFPDYCYSFFIVSNKETSKDNVFLIVERKTLANFRCDVKGVWIILANLTLDNMEFYEFVEWVDGQDDKKFTADMSII